MNEKFINYRNLYSDFIYNSYEIKNNSDHYLIIYNYEIPSLEIFCHKIIIPKYIIKRKDINDSLLKNIVFNLGIVEAISYYKCTCSKNFIIKCGCLNLKQIAWYKKLYYNGLSEFLYRNNIEINQDNFINFIVDSNYIFSKISFECFGNLICVGGGKDSCVSLELLKNESYNSAFLMNAKKPMIECAKKSGILKSDIYCVDRILDKEKLLQLNNNGFLNGHIPISSVIAFLSYLVAYLSGKKYIILSNESSANESYVKNRKINHQYSKSYEFESDFYKFTTIYFSDDIKYFSLLRPLSELEISYIFSKFKKYHSIFKSCNLGSKYEVWKWCLNCSKCLFAYIILSPFLTEDELIAIFGENLLNKESLLNDFVGLIGELNSKPFECVGTYDEVIYSVNKVLEKYLKNGKKLPYLLEYYYNKYGYKKLTDDILKNYNKENNLDLKFEKIIKEAMYE